MTFNEACDTPALALLLQVEDAGFDTKIGTHGGLLVNPVKSLTSGQRVAIRGHRAALLVLVAEASRGPGDLAWRLAAGVDLPAEVAAAVDEARVA